MRVGIWGAGNLGTGLARRLSISPHVSELHWVDRSVGKIESRAVDIQHGLAFAPCCRAVRRYQQKRVARAVSQVDVLVLTLGQGLPPDEADRSRLLTGNVSLYEETVVPAVAGFKGVVIVVTNPVDAMTWLLVNRTNLEPHRVLGLGTVVETARLRASLGSYLVPARPPREISSYVIGTHDEHCVVVAGEIAPGGELDSETLAAARDEVLVGANRAKGKDGATLHPVVEGVAAIIDAIASDSRATLTVSAHDEATDLCYSVPCAVGRDGVVERYIAGLDDNDVAEKLAACRTRLEERLQAIR
jgi:L-lactate dehydrogenase